MTEIQMTEIQKMLFELQDTKYRDFHSRLMPTIDRDRIIGVRMPVLRKLVKKLVGTSLADDFIEQLPHRYYEENNLHGLLLENCKDYESALKQVDSFLPYVDNWATCDMMNPKVFGKHKEELIQQIRIWMQSFRCYTVRYGIGMLMRYYLDEDFQKEYLESVSLIQTEEYYVKMMIAWYFATALAKQYSATVVYLETNKLDCWTHNKAIQKAVESYRISDDKKQYLRTLKRYDKKLS